MSAKKIMEDTKTRMRKAVDHTLHEFSTLHTGKASPAMVESVTVEAYGSTMKLRDVAAITTPDARLIQIQPWDKSVLKAVEKALQMANIGINPAVDGNVIRLPLPELSRERRQELTKVASRLAEEGRVAVRHARRDAMESLKKMAKDGSISEDEEKRFEKEVQQMTDTMIQEIGDHLSHKEKELLTV